MATCCDSGVLWKYCVMAALFSDKVTWSCLFIYSKLRSFMIDFVYKKDFVLTVQKLLSYNLSTFTDGLMHSQRQLLKILLMSNSVELYL